MGKLKTNLNLFFIFIFMFLKYYSQHETDLFGWKKSTNFSLFRFAFANTEANSQNVNIAHSTM